MLVKHVPKKQWMGCAIATAAMIGDLSYEEVAERADGIATYGLASAFDRTSWPNVKAARTREPRTLCALLRAVTDTEWQLTPCQYPQRPVHKFAFPQWPVAAWIQDNLFHPRFGQWIVLRDGIVNDPGLRTAYVAAQYPLGDSLVTLLAHPVRPGELTRSRVRKRLQSLSPVRGPSLQNVAEPEKESATVASSAPSTRLVRWTIFPEKVFAPRKPRVRQN